VALLAQRGNDAFDFAHRHAINGLAVRPGGHSPRIRVQTTVSEQIQLRVEQLPIKPFQRQATPSAFTQDTQDRFGFSHHAYLPTWWCPITWPPSPDCGRLSRPPWWGVIPT